MKSIYLDNNATTPLDPVVLESMLAYFSDGFGNASSLHSFGRVAEEAVDEARRKVAGLIGPCEPQDIVFTSGGTESNNFAIKGVAHALRDKGRHIITSRIEHLAVLGVCKFLEQEGYKVTYIPVDEYGIIDLGALKQAIRDDTILISVMYANNEIGTIQPVEEIAAIAREAGVVFHSDAVQALGKIDLDAEKTGASLLSLSSHKIYGPKGVGALYLGKGSRITPLIHGGHHEKNRRAGTENVPGIAGFGKACDLAGERMEEDNKRLRFLRDRLWDGIKRDIRDVRLNGHPEKRLPNTLNISIKDVDAESLLYNLDLKGIAASGGSACTSGSLEPSHVLKAIGVSDSFIRGSARFSLGRKNTETDVDFTIKVLHEVVERIRGRFASH
ncbi:MAG: cysteine desulfurase NifS [Candidatus Omnitrophica bacterium]|nr:cysteine desulfurase NifS [Candidatus Omnitrophota bacterium]